MKSIMQFTITSFILACITLGYSGQYNSIINIGDTLPTFNDLPSTSGNLLSSQDLNEDILVLISLANHCPWVKGMDEDLVALSQEFDGSSVRFIGLSMNHREDDRMPAMKIHADKVGYTFDYLYDESQSLGRALGATRTPEYFVFNKERKLVYMGALYNSPAKMSSSGNVKHINGEPTEHYVRNAISATLTGNSVAIPETRAHGCTVKYVQ